MFCNNTSMEIIYIRTNELEDLSDSSFIFVYYLLNKIIRYKEKNIRI